VGQQDSGSKVVPQRAFLSCGHAQAPSRPRFGSGANRLGESVKVFSPTIWWSVMSKRKGLEALFDGRHFDREIIILCVRWYLRYKLSLRDLVEMMAERGLSLVHNHDYALGEALYAGVRQALESFWHTHRAVMAC
jgi:hypothetical protein